MKLQAFLVMVILLCSITPLYGHEIHLTNGKIITAETVWEDGGVVKYEKYGGVISIARNRVKKIVYVKARHEKPAASAEQSSTEQSTEPISERDLTAKLKAKLSPKTPVEEASMCTLSVKTAAGFGSGFFISDNGFIITNKHVVRGDELQNKQIEEEFERALMNLREFKHYLAQEHKKIVKYNADLKDDLALLHDMQGEAKTEIDKRYIESRRRELIDYEKFLREKEQNYNKDKKEYVAQKQNFDKQLEKFQDEQRELTGQNSFEIILADDTRLYATLFMLSRQHDLALLKLPGYRTPYLKPVMQDDLSQGQIVYALGSPVNLDMKNTVTSGVLSGFRENFIQTNAQIYPGNSGGPLINEKGEVIGINTQKLVTRKFEGLGFAIPIDVALDEFKNHLSP